MTRADYFYAALGLSTAFVCACVAVPPTVALLCFQAWRTRA